MGLPVPAITDGVNETDFPTRIVRVCLAATLVLTSMLSTAAFVPVVPTAPVFPTTPAVPTVPVGRTGASETR